MDRNGHQSIRPKRPVAGQGSCCHLWPRAGSAILLLIGRFEESPHYGSCALKALWFLGVFVAVTVTVTVAAITAAFIFWSFVPVQPGTAGALAVLFLVAPGIGVVSGIVAAVRAVRKPAAIEGPGAAPRGMAPRWLLAGLAALVGGLAAYGASMAAIDLTYTERWNDPSSAPAWLPLGPPAAGLSMALLLAVIVMLSGRRRGDHGHSG